MQVLRTDPTEIYGFRDAARGSIVRCGRNRL